MITGALGVIAFQHESFLVMQTDPNTTMAQLLTIPLNLNQNEYAEIVVTTTVKGPFGWGFWVDSGPATVMGVGSGRSPTPG